MKISSANAAVILVGIGGGTAFNLKSLAIDVPPLTPSTADVKTRGPSAFIQLPCPCLDTRRCTARHMRNSYHDRKASLQTPLAGDESIDTSRRAALRQCSSVFAAVFASAWGRQEAAQASEFSDGSEPVNDFTPIEENAPPQFLDETEITPSRPQVVLPRQQEAPTTVAFSSSPSSTVGVTLKNSPVVTIPTKQVPIASSTAKAKTDTTASTVTAQQRKRSIGGVAELGLTTAVLGAVGYAVLGRVSPNTDELTAKAKVVMIAPEPYGLETGRRYYNGVDITIDDPIPSSDVLKNCDAGRVNNDCTATITGFLGNIETNSKKGMEGPSIEQQETATAVLSYLDSLAAAHAASMRAAPTVNGDVSSQTAVAFSSYLNGLANGEIRAPASPQLVADYLSSLNDVQSRMNSLETSMNRMPDEISGMMQDWQEGQDERLAKEFNKIEEHLMKMDNGCANDPGYDVPSIGLNGVVNGISANVASINGGSTTGGYGSSGLPDDKETWL